MHLERSAASAGQRGLDSAGVAQVQVGDVVAEAPRLNPDMADREIAEHTGVSDKTVAKERRAVSTNVETQLARRTGKDGKHPETKRRRPRDRRRQFEAALSTSPPQLFPQQKDQADAFPLHHTASTSARPLAADDGPADRQPRSEGRQVYRAP
jgi:hypothetical protein